MPSFCRAVYSLGFMVSLSPCLALAQGTQADYQRAHELSKLTANKVYRTNVTVNWLGDDECLWYRVQTDAQSYRFMFVDLKRKLRTEAFDHEIVARMLSEQSGSKLHAGRLPFTEIGFSKDYKTVFFQFDGRAWKVDRENSSLDEVIDEKDEATEHSSLAASASRRYTRVPRSVNGGSEVEVQFANNMPTPIRAVWIDARGNRVPYQTIPAGDRITQHTFVGHVWLFLDTDGEVIEIYEASTLTPHVSVDGSAQIEIDKTDNNRREARANNATSPDGQWLALASRGELKIHSADGGREITLGKPLDADSYFDQQGFYWSPDSKYLAAIETRPGQNRKVFMVESSPAGSVHPKLHTVPYAKPGDRVETRMPRMFCIEDRKEIDLDRKLFANPWRNSRFEWFDDSTEFRFLHNQRGHQAMRVIGIQPNDGLLRVIVNEQAQTFIDYTNKIFYHPLRDTDEIVWMSERDGWNHLYLYEAATGAVKNQITRGSWVVRDVDRVDEQKRQIWFRASGINEHQDPYYIHHCRVNFDGTNLTMLTEGDGTHSVTYSPSGKYLIDKYSRVDQPEVSTVRNTSDGSMVCKLESGDASALMETGWRHPTRFVAKGRDGETDIHGIIYWPTNFDPEKTYPVIENIYAGPHDSFVPKRFSVHNARRELAELQFIVVRIDGMGTSNRSKAFHHVCWQNLGDSGFPDRIRWIAAAAKAHPQMDTTRVGIYGGSAGGQSALRAMLAHGDFYRAAVADCGCHDNRVDKIWWNEQWMGWPIGPHYEQQSNVTNAHKLAGKLMLIVGELDRNVDPASTMQVVNALIKADKDFDLIVVPGEGHGIGSGKYGTRRMRDFFVRHLHGVEPRAK